MTMFNPSKQGRLAKALPVLGLVLVLGTGFAGTAEARPGGYGNHDRGWNGHAHAAYDWRYHHPNLAPGVVYAPPVVYAAPPPPLGLNLIVPLHIR